MTASVPTIEPPVSGDARAGPGAPAPVIDTPEMRDALECPLCGYSLRGLSATTEEPRCPECGYPFSWHQLLAARKHLHPFLFEHHSSAGSFVRTLRAASGPRRFWASLNAGHVLRVHWLLVYALLVGVALASTALAGHFVAEALKLHQRNVSYGLQDPPGWIVAPPKPPSLSALLQDAWRTSTDPDGLHANLLAACLAWPWVTVGTLLIFQTSMRRARVRSAHVLRCVIYSYGSFLWIGVLLAIAAALRAFDLLPRDRFLLSFNGPLLKIEAWQSIGCVLLVTAVASYRLGVAYARYLRFEHAGGTVLASQIIFVLVVAAAMAAFYPGVYELFL